MASSRNPKPRKGPAAPTASAKPPAKADKAKKPDKTASSNSKLKVPVSKPAVAVKAEPAPVAGAKRKSGKDSANMDGSIKGGRVESLPVEEEIVRPRVKPKLSAADRKWQLGIREALVRQRDKLLSVVQSSRAQMAGKAGDSADVSDRASEGFEDELAAGLIAIEAAQLDDIESAIQRIDDGMYGICEDCDKPIPQKRLEILPFARRCLPCEGSKQRAPRISSGYQEEESD